MFFWRVKVFFRILFLTWALSDSLPRVSSCALLPPLQFCNTLKAHALCVELRRTRIATYGHAQLLALLRDCDLVLSDSGGIQEEAPALGIPLLVLREKTERPEGISCGNSILVGTSTERILEEAQRLLRDTSARAAMSWRSFPYGDGHAAPRIASIIEDWLDQRR